MLSSRMTSIKPSATVQMTQLAFSLKQQGKPVISLSVGEPDFDTPLTIKQAGIDAINNNITRYTPVHGLYELRQAICQKLMRDNQLDYDAEQIVVSNGAKQSMFNAMFALLDSGDEVIIPAPYWVSYPDMATLAGATPVIIQAGREDYYKLTAEKLSQAITSKTKLLILNSPNNPTGMVYLNDELLQIAEVLKKHPQIYIISDDIYEYIQFTPSSHPHVNFVNIVNVAPELKDRTVLINGVSKSHAMTGWRIGYSASNQEIANAMRTLQGQMTTSACSVSQMAAKQAMQVPREDIKEFIITYKKRHDWLVERVNNIDGICCLHAQGAFYLFVDISELIKEGKFDDDVHFCMALLEQQYVSTVPGSSFGLDHHFRISYALDDASLFEAVKRIEAFVC